MSQFGDRRPRAGDTGRAVKPACESPPDAIMLCSDWHAGPAGSRSAQPQECNMNSSSSTTQRHVWRRFETYSLMKIPRGPTPSSPTRRAHHLFPSGLGRSNIGRPGARQNRRMEAAHQEDWQSDIGGPAPGRSGRSSAASRNVELKISNHFLGRRRRDDRNDLNESASEAIDQARVPDKGRECAHNLQLPFSKWLVAMSCLRLFMRIVARPAPDPPTLRRAAKRSLEMSWNSCHSR